MNPVQSIGLLIILGIIVVMGVITFSSLDNTEQKEIINDTQIKVKQFTDNNFLDSSQNTITFSVEPIPQVSDLSIPEEALSLAIKNWEENNKNIKFVKVSKSGDIDIIWKKIASPNHTGLASCYEKNDGSVYGCKLEISLGNVDCNGTFIQSDKGMVTSTIMHEVGHTFGLGHHPSETHLMYGDDVFSPTQFNDRGFVIPKLIEGFYVGEKIIWDEYDNLILQINSYQAEIDGLEREYNSLSIQYSPYESQTLEQSEYQKATSLFNQVESTRLELNRIIETSNEFVYQSNNLLNILHCYPRIDIEN